MREAINVTRAKNKAAAELKRIFTQTVLTNAECFRTLAGASVVPAQEMEEVRFLEGERAVSFFLIVNEKREGDARLFAEVARVPYVSQTDGNQPGATLTELLFVFAQLRDVLAAKNSAIVAKEDDHCR